MSTPFTGEIRIFCGEVAPPDWEFCHGQLLSVADHTALFSIIGTHYGGDGRTNFGLPDLRGAAPMHTGSGRGLRHYQLGQTTGSATVALTTEQMPSHNHTAYGANAAPDTNVPQNSYVASGTGRSDDRYQSTPNNLVPFQTTSSVGSGAGHNTMQPYLALQFIIALKGTYPPHA